MCCVHYSFLLFRFCFCVEYSSYATFLFILLLSIYIYIYRPGILADVTSRIAKKGMSLEDVSTTLRYNTTTHQREFVIDVLASSSNTHDKDNLDTYVTELRNSFEQDLHLSSMDIRVHTK